DVVNNFSSRGPTRGAHVDTSGVINRDNLLKPDLVAPGNKLVGALASDGSSLLDTLAAQHPELIIQKLPLSTALMNASGTSFAAPVVAGTAAILLQANPGLTPPLIKAILQYSAQPLPGYNLLQQGAGLVNVPGALSLAQALSTNLNTRIASGTMTVGDSMLAWGKGVPSPYSYINGRLVGWGRFVT